MAEGSAAAALVRAGFAKHFPGGELTCEQLTVLLTELSAELTHERVKSIYDWQARQGSESISVEAFLADILGDVTPAAPPPLPASMAPPPLADLKLLVVAMASDDGQAELRELFDTLDKDSNGRVSAKEWGRSVSEHKDIMSKYFGGSSAKEVGQAFRWIDADQSKDLTWEEFVDATKEFDLAFKMSDVINSPGGRVELESLWNTLDKNSDGKVSSREWGRGVSENKELLAKYFGGSSLVEVAGAFKRINANNDAHLSWTEFVNAASKFIPTIAPRPVVPKLDLRKVVNVMASDEGQSELRSLFDTLDKNANGVVSKKEWGRAVSANKELMAKYFGGSTEEEIGIAFTWIDADQSNSLRWDEFVDATKELECAFKISDAVLSPDGLAELMKLFKSLDKNVDGKVTPKEWGRGVSANKELMAKYFGGSNMGEIGRAFRRINANSDDHVSWEEFVDAATTLS
mmetsp:Transcript_80006/g.138871  ORF Transcript_80006/g.138871 Transcript_80006/m.138871 type:complete len:460 (-) Transcript_80006:16-1395(-)